MKPLTRLLLAPLLASMLLPALPAMAASEADTLYAGLREHRIALQRAEQRLEDARAAFLDVPLSRAGVSLSLAKMAFDTANLMLIMNEDLEGTRHWMTKGEGYLAEARMSVVPSRGVEARGMFIDAGTLPKTEAGVVALVDKLAKAHFNVLLPEVFRRGYTIYESSYTDRDPEFKDAPDVLAVLVREAHKHGMEVHPWIWAFRVKSPGYGDPVLSRLPALAARKGDTEPRFLSPAHPQAREYLYGLIRELTDRYGTDGLLLDYIRYDETIQEDDISRTEFALAYRARHGKLPPAVIPPNSELMLEWQLWREQQVNTAVQEISRMLKANHPRFPIGVAVFRGEGYSRLQKMQHWRHWSNNRWVDFAAPMLYTSKPEDLSRWLSWETDKGTRDNLLYPILGVHRFAHTDNLVEQLELLNAEHEPGVMIFALAHFDMTLLDELAAGPFRTPAALPHRNLMRATRRTLAETNGYLSRVFTRGDFETAASARMLHREITAVAQSLPLHELPYWQNDALAERLGQVRALAGDMPWPAPVLKEVQHRLDYAIALVEANRFQVEGTRYVPSSLPPIKVLEEQRHGPQD